MKVGAVFPQTEIGTDARVIRDFAVSVERAGYDYVLAYDHVVGAHPERFAGPIGGFASAPYTAEHPFHEVFTLFGHLAAVTERVELATSVIILPQRGTALAAKQAATVDILSGGRLRLGVGVGWNFAEYAALGHDFRTRGRRIEEQIAVLRMLWTQPLVTFRGAHHDLDRVGLNPLPCQRPIPVWIGSGASERSLSRVARVADGWLPLLQPGEDLGEALGRLRAHLDAERRDPSGFGIDARVNISRGDPDTWRREIDRFRALDVTHVALNTGRAGHDPRWHVDMLLRYRDLVR